MNKFYDYLMDKINEIESQLVSFVVLRRNFLIVTTVFSTFNLRFL